MFIEKRALGLYISFVDLSTRRNIEQTPLSLYMLMGNPCLSIPSGLLFRERSKENIWSKKEIGEYEIKYIT